MARATLRIMSAFAVSLLSAPALLAQTGTGLELADAYEGGPVSSLPEAVALALRTNPSLDIQRGVEDEAQAELDSARALGNVRVDLSAGGGVQNTDTNSPFAFTEGGQSLLQAQIQASKPVWTSGRIPASIRAAQAGLGAAGFDTEAARQQLILDVVTAYADLNQARETVVIRENNVALAGEQRQAAEDRFRVGEITRTDVSLANAREEGAKANLAAAQASLAAAEARFAEVVGAPAGQLAAPPPRPDLPRTVDIALEQALDQNPAILSALANVRAAEEAVRAAKAALKPQVSVVGRASAQEVWDYEYKDTSVSVLGQATIPLYDGDQIRSQTRAAKARLRQAESGLDLARRRVIANLTAAWSGLLAADRAITASRAQVAAAEIAFNGTKEELSVGQRTTLDVLDTEQDLFDARLSLLAAQRDAYLAGYQVLAAMGALDASTVPALFAVP